MHSVYTEKNLPAGLTVTSVSIVKCHSQNQIYNDSRFRLSHFLFNCWIILLVLFSKKIEIFFSFLLDFGTLKIHFHTLGFGNRNTDTFRYRLHAETLFDKLSSAEESFFLKKGSNFSNFGCYLNDKFHILYKPLKTIDGAGVFNKIM